MDFVNYCKTQGLHLLGEDVKFVRHRLHFVEKTQRRNFMMRYVSLWQQAMDEEQEEHRKQSRGRYAANRWLVANTCM